MAVRRTHLNRERPFAFLKVDVVGHSEMVRSGRRAYVTALLDQFEKYVDGVVRRRGGEVWSWQGDGGLCAFEAGPRRRNVETAVEAALDILRGVSAFDLSREPFVGAKEGIKVRIAAHVGAAEVRQNRGRIHSPDINFVAHLEREATPNSIIASQETLNECRKEIQALFHKLDEKFEHADVCICELYGQRRIATWDKILNGIGILFRRIQQEGFEPDLVIGCGRSAGIVGAILAGNLGQEAFVVLARKLEETAGRRIRFDHVTILNADRKILSRKWRLLTCFYQVSTGQTADAFCSYLTQEAGFSTEQIRLASLFMEQRGRRHLERQGFQCFSAFEGKIPFGDTPWKLNDKWEWL